MPTPFYPSGPGAGPGGVTTWTGLSDTASTLGGPGSNVVVEPNGTQLGFNFDNVDWLQHIVIGSTQSDFTGTIPEITGVTPTAITVYTNPANDPSWVNRDTTTTRVWYRLRGVRLNNAQDGLVANARGSIFTTLGPQTQTSPNPFATGAITIKGT